MDADLRQRSLYHQFFGCVEDIKGKRLTTIPTMKRATKTMYGKMTSWCLKLSPDGVVKRNRTRGLLHTDTDCCCCGLFVYLDRSCLSQPGRSAVMLKVLITVGFEISYVEHENQSRYTNHSTRGIDHRCLGNTDPRGRGHVIDLTSV